MKKDSWTSGLSMAAFLLTGFLIISLWQYKEAIALATAVISLAGGAGYIGVLIFQKAALARSSWLEADTLRPEPNSFQYPARIKKDGSIIRPGIDNAPQFAKVTHFHSSNIERENVLKPPAELITPLAANQELPISIDLLSVLKDYRPSSASFELILGISENGTPIIKPFGDSSLHFGLLGATFSGKSSFAHSIITQLILHDPGNRRLDFFFLDFKGKTSRPFKNALHTGAIARDPSGAGEILEFLYSEMRRRESFTEAEMCQERIYLLVLEEFLDLIDDLTDRHWQIIKSIFTGGRHAGIYCMGLSQAFYSDNKELRILRGQMRTRCAFAVEDSGTLKAFGFEDKKMQNAILADPKPGRFLYRASGEILLAQAPYITEEKIAELLKRPEPETKGTARPGSTWDSVPVYSARNAPPASFRFLPEPPPKVAPDVTPPISEDNDESVYSINKAYAAYQNGATSINKLAAALGIARETAKKRLEKMNELGMIKWPPGRTSID